MPETYIRGNTIKYVRVPPEVRASALHQRHCRMLQLTTLCVPGDGPSPGGRVQEGWCVLPWPMLFACGLSGGFPQNGGLALHSAYSPRPEAAATVQLALTCALARVQRSDQTSHSEAAAEAGA